MQRLIPGLLSLLLCTGGAVAAESSARQWLERMSQAAHNLNYEGTFVYWHDGHMQTMRIVHGNDVGGERERLMSLSGPTREVIRDKEKVTCILTDGNETVVERTGPGRLLPLNLPSRLGALERHYSFSLGGSERVAGFTAQKVIISPRDRYRYGHNFWLHQDNGLLLRSDLLNEQGEVVEQIMFTALTFHDKLPALMFEPETQGRETAWRRTNELADAPQEVLRWDVARLPAGFVLDSKRRHLMQGKSSHVDHLVYSDGLASVSVFVEKDEGDALPLGNSRMGAVTAYARQKEGYTITVVGEVPPLTVQQIAESVERRGDLAGD